MTVPLTRAPASPNRVSGLARSVKHSTRRHHFEITQHVPIKEQERRRTQRPRRPSAFPGDRVRAGDAMHVLVCGIDPALPTSRIACRHSGVPPLRPASRYTGVRMLEKPVIVSLCLTYSHAQNASHPGKRAPQVVLSSRYPIRTPHSQRAKKHRGAPASEDAPTIASRVHYLQRCSMSERPLEKDRFTRSCGCCRELRSRPQGKLRKRLPSPKYAADSLT